MTSRTFYSEFQKTKSLLKGFLGRTFLDSSLLLGFVTINQQSFHKFIINDLDGYLLVNSEGDVEQEFHTIKYLDQFWSEFHYPIVKYFQSQHAEFFSNINEDFKKSKHDGRKFNVKPVEARKLHENFIKYVKLVSLFYFTLLKHFCTQYNNPFMPNKILRAFNLELEHDAKDSFLPSTQANLLYLVHKVLLCLGDLHRHRTFMETTFILPCMSVKDYFAYKDMTGAKKKELWGPRYERALQFYSYCIILLPALNEPYNHTGMIYNLIDDKYRACLWLLRSQFTRLPEYKLGLTNLQNILSKGSFINRLQEISSRKSAEGSQSFDAEDLNIFLMCLSCYFYVPSVYKRGPNVLKGTSFSRLENELFKSISDNMRHLLSVSEAYNGTFFILQLTVLFTVNELLFQAGAESADTAMKFSKFTFRYIENFFEGSAQVNNFDTFQKATYLMTLRFILSWIKENKMPYRIFISRFGTMEKLASVLNSFLSQGVLPIASAENSGVADFASQEAADFLKNNTRPTRSFFFEEDVQFRDFLLIRFQFKDFKDDHLFASENINLLVGDYDTYLEATEIPTFLKNEAVSRIKEKFEPEAQKVAAEVLKYAVNLRIISVLVLGKRLVESSPGNIHYDSDTTRFIVKPFTKEKQEQRAKTIEPAVKDGINNGRIVSSVQNQKPNHGGQPTIEDIESVIANHASKMVFKENTKLKGQIQRTSVDAHLESNGTQEHTQKVSITNSSNIDAMIDRRTTLPPVPVSHYLVPPPQLHARVQMGNTTPIYNGVPGMQVMQGMPYQQQLFPLMPQAAPSYHPNAPLYYAQPVAYGTYPVVYPHPVPSPADAATQQNGTYVRYQ